MASRYDAIRDAGPYLGLGWQLAVSLLAFVTLGYWADRLFGTEPWLLCLGAILGMTAMIIRIVYLIRRTSSE